MHDLAMFLYTKALFLVYCRVDRQSLVCVVVTAECVGLTERCELFYNGTYTLLHSAQTAKL